ncbi:uncharacterized protein LOC141840129 [Curcuma longa]|uniref:uncharacterized protein LOC141840129 n=1 Tax=Curcuma longa TaxID=136217 RepID=UPI003D9EF9BE
MGSNKNDWSKRLEDALWAYRIAYKTPIASGIEEIRLDAYENSCIYKEKTKGFRDKHIVPREFQIDDKVLLYKSCLRFMNGKLRSRWEGPYIVTDTFSYGVIEIHETSTRRTFTVNGYYYGYYDLAHKGQS